VTFHLILVMKKALSDLFMRPAEAQMIWMKVLPGKLEYVARVVIILFILGLQLKH